VAGCVRSGGASGELEVNGVESARGEGIVGAGIVAAIVEREELDAIKTSCFAPIDERNQIEEFADAAAGLGVKRGKRKTDAMVRLFSNKTPMRIAFHFSSRGLGALRPLERA
jgi:hypothetical protein